MTMEMHRGSAAAAPSPCALERKPSPVPGIGANFVTQVVKPQCFTNALKVGLADHSRAQPQRLSLGFVSRLRHANPGSVMPAQPWRGPEPMYTTVVTPKLALMPGTGEGLRSKAQGEGAAAAEARRTPNLEANRSSRMGSAPCKRMRARDLPGGGRVSPNPIPDLR